MVFALIILGVVVFRSSESPANFPSLPFLKVENDYYIYDDVAGHLHRPNARREYKWPEHKSGKIIMNTNNLGFRENADTEIQKVSGVIRILVTGDSHIDSVVYNGEFFPNQLEGLLNKGNTNPSYECINGGVGNYGPHNYSGFLKDSYI